MKCETIILLHGGPGFNDSYFYPYLTPLKEQYNVTSYTIGTKTTDLTIEGITKELRDFLFSINSEKISIIAHSFASILVLNQELDLFRKLNKIILCNWVYDNKWIDLFYSKFPNEKRYISKSLKEDSVHYLPYYFKDLNLGRHVFNKISFNDQLQRNTSSIYSNLDLKEKLSLYASKITSITSELDQITPSTYILEATKKFGITNYNIEDCGHFPFIEKPEEFIKIVNKTLGEN